MFARIGITLALHHRVRRELNPSRKDTRWGGASMAAFEYNVADQA
jgi:hypothetical protein